MPIDGQSAAGMLCSHSDSRCQATGTFAVAIPQSARSLLMKVLLDVGGVSAPFGDTKRYVFEAIAHGALAFMSVTTLKWGSASLFIVSKVNSGWETPERLGRRLSFHELRAS